MIFLHLADIFVNGPLLNTPQIQFQYVCFLTNKNFYLLYFANVEHLLKTVVTSKSTYRSKYLSGFCEQSKNFLRMIEINIRKL